MITLVNDKSQGLTEYMGKRITVFGVVYIYTGKLVGVDKTFLKLEDAAIVYETGPFKEDDKKWKDAQSLPHSVLVKLSNVESVMELK